MGSLFLQQLKAQTKGVLRRQRDRFFPDRGTRRYRTWMKAHLAERARRYDNRLDPGLLSIITPVWDGSPAVYLRELAQSIARQIETDEARWVILANGCSNPALVKLLKQLEAYRFVSMQWLPENVGIAGGLRRCLEQATSRYVLPVDADDRLYPDALRIVTAHIQQQGYPPLLYTDEDKISGAGLHQPYFKPDWDPVLLSNSAYIAHLGVIDRKLALKLGAYSGKQAEGSADWDLFTRFASAGYAGIHIPEVVYSWRIHAESTADDGAAKPYIRSSQEAVLGRFLDSHCAGANFSVEASPLFGARAAHLRLVRRPGHTAACRILQDVASLDSLAAAAQAMAQEGDLVGIVSSDVEVDPAFADWQLDALGVFELFPDTMMVGGRVSNEAGLIVDGPRYLGFGHFGNSPAAGRSPDAGRSVSDPGYFGQMWKQRSVGALSTRLALIRAADLIRVLSMLPREATLDHLGCWIGADAFRSGKRVVYSPYLHARERRPGPMRMSHEEESAFRTRYAEMMPDRRYYPMPFSLEAGYEIASEI